ncbi:MAG: ABC transporter permease [Chloroflexota bacterium]|jgi:ABC-type nitrate/sulfonate/bicarbonate transport system permease component
MRSRHILLAAAVLTLAWQLAAMAVNASLLPGPGTAVSALIAELPKGLAHHFLVSGWRLVASMAIATLLAAPAGLAIGQSRKLNALISPLVYIAYPIPKIVFLPIIMLFLGTGDSPKVFIIALILFFQILVVVRDACLGVRQELVQSVKSLGAGRLELLRWVYLPACLPAILTALRVSTGTAVAVLFLAETFATQSGLAYYITVEAWGRMAYPEMYAGVIAMAFLGLITYIILDYIEHRACEWMVAK